MSFSPVRLNHAVLFGVGAAGGPKRRGGIGLYHLALQLGADPDGNEFELMWMLPRDEWGPYENAAPIDHLDLAGEVQRWSGIRTAGRLAPGTEEALS